MARITIIVEDGFISVDGISKAQPHDFSVCGIPPTIHALQWFDTFGWVEFRDDDDPSTSKPANQEITELPAWANACVAVHDAWVPEPPVEIPNVDVPVATLPSSDSNTVGG